MSGDTPRTDEREGFIPIPFKHIVMEWEQLKVERDSLRTELEQTKKERDAGREQIEDYALLAGAVADDTLEGWDVEIRAALRQSGEARAEVERLRAALREIESDSIDSMAAEVAHLALATQEDR